jgi:Uma2 family endonuclease
MSTVLPPAAPIRTLADLLERLGGIPPRRVLFHPPPGTATERDVFEVRRRENRVCELVDGVLVEKAMGYRESALACALIELLGAFVRRRNLGVVTGEAGTVRLYGGLLRIPDVAFTSWARLPRRRMPAEPVPELAPDLAVEVLSEGNTPEEMERKRSEYFAAGVRQVWIADPHFRTVHAYSRMDQFVLYGEGDTLHAGEILPGFVLPLREWFAELDRQG